LHHHSIQTMALTRNYYQLNSSWNAPYTFSGKEKDAETGYGYFGARYYDSGLSIWLSVDPMSDKYPSMSPYNYCANNPVILVDPDGKYFKFAPSVTREQNSMFFDAVRYLDKHNCGGQYGMLKNSPRGYTILISTNPDDNGYNPETRTITWCPYYAFLTANGNILSPGTILNHEMAHAALYEAAILNIQKNAEKYGSTVANQMYIEEYNALSDPHPQYDKQSDAKIIPGVETRTGILTGEVKKGQVSREEHNKGTYIYVGSPISTSVNVNGNQDDNQDVNQDIN